MNMKMGIEAALRICFLLFLLSASWQDLKKRLLKKYVPDMGNGRGHSSGSTYFQPDFYGNRKMGMQVIVQEVTGLMFAALLGILLLSLSTATEEAMGKGDGCFFSGSRDLPWFLEKYAAVIRRSVLCFPAAVYLMIKGRKARNTESIPFLPFVFPVGLGVLFL